MTFTLLSTTFLLLIATVLNVSAQKRAYVPAYIRDTTTIEGRQFTWSKTAQSKNFLMIWATLLVRIPRSFPIQTCGSIPCRC